jgi:MFS family permease
MRTVIGLRRADEEPLPAVFRRFNGSLFVAHVGTGLVMPFIPIYVTTHLGLGVGALGPFFAVTAGSTLLAALVGGRLIDSLGSRVVLVAASVLLAVANLWFAVLTDLGSLLAVAVLTGLGGGPMFAALVPMVLALVPEAQHRRAFGLRYLAVNAGVGLGTAIGTVTLGWSGGQGTFRLLFLLKALTFVQFALLMRRMDPVRPTIRSATGGDRGFRALLSSRPVLLLLAVQALLVTFCFVQFSASIPVVVHDFMGLGIRLVGAIAIVNTVAAVVLQVPVLAVLRRVSDAGALAYAAAGWVFAFGLGLIATVAGERTSVVLLVVFSVVFAGAACAYSAAFSPLLAKVVPAELIGRVSGLSSVVWNVGLVVGPWVVLGGATGFDGYAAWLIMLVASGLAGVLALTLRSSVRSR